MTDCPYCRGPLTSATKELGENMDTGGVGREVSYSCPACQFEARCITLEKYRSRVDRWWVLHWPAEAGPGACLCEYVDATPQHRLCRKCGEQAES